MDMKEIAPRVLYSFFIIFTCSLVAMCIFALFAGYRFIAITDLFVLLGLAILTSLAGFIFYSKKELSKRQMLIRNIIHFLLIQGIIFSAAFLVRWIFLHYPGRMVLLVVLVSIVYVVVYTMEGYKTKRLADRLTQKLHDYYDKKEEREDKNQNNDI